MKQISTSNLDADLHRYVIGKWVRIEKFTGNSGPHLFMPKSYSSCKYFGRHVAFTGTSVTVTSLGVSVSASVVLMLDPEKMLSARKYTPNAAKRILSRNFATILESISAKEHV